MSSFRWLRIIVVVAAAAMLLAVSCSWDSGAPIPDGVPPPPGDPVPAVNTHAAGRPAGQLKDWAAQRAPAQQGRRHGEHAAAAPAPAVQAGGGGRGTAAQGRGSAAGG